MISNSDKLAQMIRAMQGPERQAVASVATFHLSKDNIAPVGTGRFRFPRIEGMAKPIFQVLQALQEAGGVSGDWTMCEAPISKSGKLAVLLFRGAERDVCAEIERLVQVAQVQHS